MKARTGCSSDPDEVRERKGREGKLARKRLDEEMRPYRRAGLDKNPTNGLLRAVRKALGIPMAEVAGKMGVSVPAVFELELNESKGSLKLSSMSRVAEALGCKLVYGIVPQGGRTLEWLAEKRLWASILSEDRDQGSGVRDQGLSG